MSKTLCEEEYLQMSGILHFCFCRRQWALIHIEQQWRDNVFTVKGEAEHEKCHDLFKKEKRGKTIITRGMRVVSHKLKLSGSCDVVEFHSDPSGIPLRDTEGLWLPFPVEYKHGISKEIDADRLQLCAQAMALEEMLVCSIPKGALFYEATKRREEIIFTEELREKTLSMAAEMVSYAERGYTPKVKKFRGCSLCSLADICLPALSKNITARGYMLSGIEE